MGKLRSLTTGILAGTSILSIALAGAGNDALAQAAGDLDPNRTVFERTPEDFEPLGIRAGAFMINPQIFVGAEFNDNIRATEDNEDSDVGLSVTPIIAARSNWVRHGLNLTLGSDMLFNASETDENYQDFFGIVDGRIDVSRTDVIRLNMRQELGHEDRTSADDQGEDELTDIFRSDYRATYRKTFNRLFAQLGGSAIRRNYDNDGPVNRNRDNWRYEPSLRVGYELSPRFNLFGQGRYNWVRYDSDTIGGIEQDSEGFRLEVGTEVDFTGIIFGEFALGYLSQDYEDDDRNDVTGPSAEGVITWNITPLTSLIFNARAEVAESTVNFEGDRASSNFVTAGGVEVQHELLRNVRIGGDVNYVNEDFEGTSRTDDTIIVGLTADYFINRRLSLDARYEFRDRSSDNDPSEFTRNLFRVGLTARW